tara:strand:+ start:44 stop:763 length:720 start_codon:yes stop_codon:yes gene_type:complete
MGFKMKGSPMHRNFGVGASPTKQKYDVNGTDERAYDIDQKAYDNWRGTEDINTGEKGNAPNVRYLGQSENKEHLEDYLEFKKSLAKSTKKTIDKNKGTEIGPRNKDGGFTTSPSKQKKGGKTYSTKAHSVVSDEGTGDTKNSKGQNQEDVVKSRKKSIAGAHKSLKKGKKSIQKAVNKGMDGDYANKEMAVLLQNLQNAYDNQHNTADSLNLVNPVIMEDRQEMRKVDAQTKYENKKKK